ncbi:MAG: helix-turn-helix domain-containing protein [Microgenomates group bacterium]
MTISNLYKALKERAIRLRSSGQSYREISETLSVNKSTLNGWLKNIPLTPDQKYELDTKWKEGMVKARMRSLEVKKEAKQKNIIENQVQAAKFIKTLTLNNSTLELFLAGLYLGDGFKTNGRLGLGNANPQLVLLFINLIRKLYKIDESKLRAEIFGRADQNPEKLVNYWSQLLQIPKHQFHHTQLDARATKPTRDNYYGVCAVNYSSVNLQRHILAIGDEMLKYNP